MGIRIETNLKVESLELFSRDLYMLLNFHWAAHIFLTQKTVWEYDYDL